MLLLFYRWVSAAQYLSCSKWDCDSFIHSIKLRRLYEFNRSGFLHQRDYCMRARICVSEISKYFCQYLSGARGSI